MSVCETPESLLAHKLVTDLVHTDLVQPPFTNVNACMTYWAAGVQRLAPGPAHVLDVQPVQEDVSTAPGSCLKAG